MTSRFGLGMRTLSGFSTITAACVNTMSVIFIEKECQLRRFGYEAVIEEKIRFMHTLVLPAMMVAALTTAIATRMLPREHTFNQNVITTVSFIALGTLNLAFGLVRQESCSETEEMEQYFIQMSLLATVPFIIVFVQTIILEYQCVNIMLTRNRPPA